MKCFLLSLCVIAVSFATVASSARAQESLSPQLMLRPSYFYVEVDPISAQPIGGEATEEPEQSLSPKGKRIAIGVSVALAVVIGITAAVSATAVNRAFDGE